MAGRFRQNWDEVREVADSQMGGDGFKKDPRMFKLQMTKEGIGQALIRFLPAPDSKVPYVLVMNHGFQRGGKWFIQNCPKTHGWDKDCPICEDIQPIYDEYKGNQNKIAELVKDRGRKKQYIANILVIKDPANPENNGKVMLYKFGQKIFEKINNAWKPPSDSLLEKVEVFDYYDGADFLLYATKSSNGSDYSTSKFQSVAPLFGGDDAKIEVVHNQRHNIMEFVAPEEFKSYETLKNDYEKFMGTSHSHAEPRNVPSTPSAPIVETTEAETNEDIETAFNTSSGDAEDSFFDQINK